MAETITIENNEVAPSASGAPDPSVVTMQTDRSVDWQTHIPQGYEKDKAFDAFRSKGLSDVLKSFAEGRKVIDSSVRLPGKDAKPDDLAKWKADHGPKLAALGLWQQPPESPEAYKFDRPEAAIELGWDEDAEKAMRGVFHKAGMTNDQVKAVIAGYAEAQGVRLAKADAYFKETVAALQKEWGSEYEPRMGRAVRFIKETGGEYGISELMSLTGLGNNPNVIKWVNALASTGVEHGSFAGTASEAITPEDRNQRATEIRTQMQKTNAGSAAMKALEAELESLYRRGTAG